MRMCRECSGSGQDPNCSRAAACLSCDGEGYIPEYSNVDVPAIAIVDAIEALDDYANRGRIELGRGRCRALADELELWFNEV